MSKRKKNSGPFLFGLIVVALAVVGVVTDPGGWFEGEEVQTVDGVAVRRGPLRISEISRGNLEAKDSATLINELEGRTTILYLVDEGTYVREGDLVCELDVSEQRDREISQKIAVQNSESSYTNAKEQYDIQVIQNESDIAKAELDLTLAKLELEKYIEDNGEATNDLAKAEESIQVAMEELKQAEDQLKWTKELHEKGFAQRTELERDELSVEINVIRLAQAKRDKDLLERYQRKMREAELKASVATAEREVLKVKKQAVAKLADYKAAKTSAEFELDQERDRLARLEGQLAKAEILAPVEGMVVYARERSRWGNGEVPQEGGEVRERQELVKIPRAGGMIADVSLHETKLDKVQVGQRCLVTVDAIPGKMFQGKISFVAAVADSNSWMSNPNQRLYRTEVALVNSSAEMRPGMSCEIEILVDDLEDVLYVPRQAVFLDGESTICFISNAQGAPEAVPVSTGLDNNSFVVIESGLDEGQIVMLSPPPSWEPAPAKRETTEDPGKPDGFDSIPTSSPGSGGSAQSGARGERGGESGGGRRGGMAAMANMSKEDRAAALERFKQSDVYKNMSDEQKAEMAKRMSGGGSQ